MDAESQKPADRAALQLARVSLENGQSEHLW
jgi:hypothetical protein